MTSPTCPHCGSGETGVHSKPRNRWICRHCGKTFSTGQQGASPLDRAIALDREEPGATVDGNSACLFDESDAPLTAEQVMDKFGFSQDEWLIERARPGYHDMGYKDKNTQTPGAIRLWNMKVWLVRAKAVVCEWPVVQPVKAPRLRQIKVPTRDGLKRCIVVPDIHAGYRRLPNDRLIPMHDLRACAIVAQVIRETKPDLVIMLGDNLDLPDWSDKFPRHPDCSGLTQPALLWLSGWIASWREYAGRVIYLEGNHESRITRALISNIQAAVGVKPVNSPTDHPALSVPRLLDLDGLDVEWIADYPKNEVWVNENLRARHGEKLAPKPGHTVGKALESAVCSVLFGHSHIVELAFQTVRKFGKTRVHGACCFGTLARIDGWAPPHAGADVHWQQAFGYIEYQDAGAHLYDARPVMIYGGRAIFNGKVYDAREQWAEMDADGKCNDG